MVFRDEVSPDAVEFQGDGVFPLEIGNGTFTWDKPDQPQLIE